MHTAAVTIHLVRHGRVLNPCGIFYGRLPGFPLSGRGMADARRAGTRLAREPLAALYTSPLLRARQTAAEIGACHDLVPRVCPLMVEIDSAWEGLPAAEVRDRGEDIYTGAPPGFEQPADILTRVRAFIRQVLRDHTGTTVAAVTHGDVIAFTVLHVRGVSLSPANRLHLRDLGLSDAYPTPGSLTTLTVTPDGQVSRLRYCVPD